MVKRISKLEVGDIAVFVAIGVVTLWLSYMMAAQLYEKSHLIPHGVLLVSCFLLLQSLVAGCYTLLQKVSSLAMRKPEKLITSVPAIEHDQEEQEHLKEIIEQRESEVQAKAEEFIQKRKETIRRYILWAMAPLLEKEDLEALCIEYGVWLDNPQYKPEGRYWKWKQNVDVSHIDVRHMTWNIAKRMGMDKGYSTVVCGHFIKDLFPDLCKRSNWFTLSKSLNTEADKGNIKIDVQDDKDPIAFHYPLSQNEDVTED